MALINILYIKYMFFSTFFAIFVTVKLVFTAEVAESAEKRKTILF